MSIIWFLIKLVFWLVLAFAFLHACVTHFLLWYEWRVAKLQNQPTPYISRMSFIKSFIIEFFCIIIKTVLHPFQFWSFAPKTKETRSRTAEGLSPPILLVHGYLNHQADWLWFQKRLKNQPGIGPIYSINLLPPFASISQFALQLQEKVQEILETTQAKQIILIGHSMGGLVCSYYSEYLAKPNEVAMVITIGSPFQGTRLSALGYGENVKEMGPNSTFLAELRARIHQSTIPYYSIASKIDNMIIPWQSALLSNELAIEKNLILDDHGHLRLLISPLIVAQITKWIALQSKGIY
jgi:triacylglycerol lipase